MVGAKGTGVKKHPGEPSAGMSNAKITTSIPNGTPPSGSGQTSGSQAHKQMSAGQKVENLSNFPKKRKGLKHYDKKGQQKSY